MVFSTAYSIGRRIMPNIKEIENTIQGLEVMQDTILLFKKYEQGEGRKFPIIHLDGTGHWLHVDASLFCIKNALQLLKKTTETHVAQ